MIEEIKQSDLQQTSSEDDDDIVPEDHDVGGVSDELTEEQTRAVFKQILGSIKEFRECHKISEEKYFGVSTPKNKLPPAV